MRVKLEDFSVAVQLELDGYAEEVRQGVTEELKKAGKLCLQLLRKNSPKKIGKYAKSWVQKIENQRGQPVIVIYNKKYGWLAHLLENGHAKKTGGRVNGIPHIRPAAEQAQRQLLENIQEIL